MLESWHMVQPKSLLLYRGEAASGAGLKLVLVLIPAVLLFAGIYIWSSDDKIGGLILTGESLVVGLLLWAVIPRRYEVYEDHLRIVLGGPLGFNIGFSRVRSIEISNRSSFTMNFVTTIARSYIIINRRGGISVAITPRSQDLFLENANRALSQWAKNQPEYSGYGSYR